MSARLQPPETIYVPSVDVYFQTIGGEAVLLDVRTGFYFGLDEVGTRIWELMGPGVAVATIADRLAQEYDAAESTLRSDVAVFMSRLESKGLVSRAADNVR